MKIYIAGKLCTENEREFLEKLVEICEELGFETFLPHREVGLAEDINDVDRIFNGDIKEGFKNIDLVVVNLNGLHVGAGTAWELGYAYANKIPCIGIKTDESIKDALESLSAILIYSVNIVNSIEKLKERLRGFKKNH